MRRLPSICNICLVRCPVVVDVQGDKVAKIAADDVHPFGGLACVKGKAAGELLDHPERVRHPLKRVGPKTAAPEWVRVSWDEALDTIATRLLCVREEHGAEAIAFSKGTITGTGVVDADRWVRRLANVLGTPNAVGTSHMCQWPRDEGTRYTFGVRLPWPDLERSGSLLLWGCNPSATNIRLAHDIRRACARGMKLVTVDPRRVGLAPSSDLHLPVVPGTDGALALSLAHVLVVNGAYDRDFVRAWTNAPLLVREDTGQLLQWDELRRDDIAGGGFVAWAAGPVRYVPEVGRYSVPFEQLDLEAALDIPLASGQTVRASTVFRLLRALLADYPPERAAQITGVAADQISVAARILAEHHPVAHYFWNGITQHTNAAQNGRAISILYALLGDFDTPGGNVLGPLVPTNVVERNDLLSRQQVARRLGYHERPLGTPRTSGTIAAYDLYRAVLEGEPYPVQALLAFGSNLVIANGGSDEGREALQRLPFMVSVDYFLTPTAQLADFVLPAATFLEAPALNRGWYLPLEAQSYLQYRVPVVTPRGEVRSDTQIVFDLAVRLGLGEFFWNGDVEAATRYELEPSGVTLEQLREHPRGAATVLSQHLGRRQYAQETGDGGVVGFATPTRKVEIFCSRFAEEGQNGLPRYEAPAWSAERAPEAATAYPLVLTNAKVPQFCHSQGRALPSLRRARPHPQIEVHPTDAAAAGVRAGEWVLVETPEGAIRARVKVAASVRPGVVVAQAGWWQGCETLGLPPLAPYSADGANVNLLVSNRRRDPISGGTPHRSARCRLRFLGEHPV